jgi:hypothetical protein
MSREEILKTARIGIKLDKAASEQYQAWYVQIDDQRVSPKWLIAQLTGLSVQSFHSREARRLLERFGININSVHAD